MAGFIFIPDEGKSLEAVVREAVALTLKITKGNQAKAAKLLQVSRPTVAKKMPDEVETERAAVNTVNSPSLTLVVRGAGLFALQAIQDLGVEVDVVGRK